MLLLRTKFSRPQQKRSLKCCRQVVAMRRRVKRMWEERTPPLRTDALHDLDVSYSHIYIVPKVWEHSTIKMHLKEGKFFPFIGSSGACFPHHLFLMLLANVTEMPTTSCCVRRPLRQGSDGPVSRHLCKSGAWNASESYQCLHFVSVPGGGCAPARRYKTNTPAEGSFAPLRLRGQNQTAAN